MKSEVLVLGAGVTGLACAQSLARRGVRVRVVDAAARPGGVVGSLETNGFHFEQGPNTIPASAATFRTLCGELGLADDLIASRPAAKTRFLYFRGQLQPLPSGPISLLTTPLLPASGKLRLVLEPLRRRARAPEGRNEPTFEELMTERLGPAAARTFAGAFVRGVYAAEASELGAASAFPRLWDLVQENGGLIRGLRAAGKARRAAPTEPLPGPECKRSDLLSLRGGLGRLTEALAGELEGALQLEAVVEEVTRTEDGFAARLASGETHEATQLVVALPSHATAATCAGLLEGLDLPLLTQLPHASVTVVHLGLDSAPLPEGFGFLVPPDEAGPEAPRALGVLFPSRQFEGRAPEGRDAISAIYRTADLGDDDPIQVAREDLRRALGASPDVTTSKVVSWNDVIPRYAVGHAPRAARLVSAARERHPGLFLAGNWEGGVSVEDCLARGRRVAAALTGEGAA